VPRVRQPVFGHIIQSHFRLDLLQPATEHLTAFLLLF